MLKITTKIRLAVSFAVSAFLSIISPVQAQVNPDNTLPINSQVSPGSCAVCTVIDGGTVRGANLFHSFQEFSIPTGGEAYFNNAAQIQNILIRVTGSSLSNIDGLIRANGIANLYLLNPNGIVFSPNASLNIGGSFVGTTADSFQFPDGSEYSATNPQPPSLLAVNLVPGVQFGERKPESTITNAGNLAVAQGQSLRLLGGTITSTGTLTAPGGKVSLVAMRGDLRIQNATIDTTSTGEGVAGNITLRAGNLVEIDNAELTAFSNSESTTDFTKVKISGDSVRLNQAYLSTTNTNTGFAGDIAITARNSVDILDSKGDNATTRPGIFSRGNNGRILIGKSSYFDYSPNTLTINNSQLVTENSTDATGDFKAGDISIMAKDSVSILNESIISSSTNRNGKPGNIEIKGTTVNLESKSQILSSIKSGGVSDTPGTINITTGTLNVNSEANLQTIVRGADVANNLPAGQGNAGEIRIVADHAVTFDNGFAFSTIETGAIGNAGTIDIKTGTLTVKGKGELQTLVRGADVANNLPAGQGNAGEIKIVADEVTFNGGSAFSTIEPGAIGNAGTIDIQTGTLTVKGGAQLQTLVRGKDTITQQRNAGGIVIVADNTVTFDKGSALSSVGKGVTGDAGAIGIKTGMLTVKDHSEISTTNSNDGQAGFIFINARDQVLIENNSNVSSQGGSGGIFIGTELITDGNNGIIKESSLRSFTLDNFSSITTNVKGATASKIEAGGIFINARDQVLIENNSTVSSNGNRGGIFIGTEVNSDGKFITQFDGQSITKGSLRSLKLLNNSSITTNVEGVTTSEIEAGSIFINARDRITFDNSSVKATSNIGNGGNITIDPDIFLLRRGSQISTSSGIQGSGGGKGGNITINSKFIVSAPLEKNDIFANAFDGSGGKITINAINLYWMDVLSRNDLERRLGTNDPTKLKPDNLPTNDITAISQTNPTLNGVVTVNALNLDVTQGLGELNLVPVDTSKLIAQGCITGKQFTLNENKFVVTGRSGITATPEDVLRSSRILTELGTPTTSEDLASRPATPAATTSSSTSPPKIIEAQGWIVAPNGKIRLVAQSNNPTASSLQQVPITCPADSSPLNP